MGHIFSGKVVDHVASRPGYPPALLDALERVGALRADPGVAGIADIADIADLGAGTGLLTQALLARGHRVVVIEPNADMRRAADALLGHHPRYRSHDGTAEATGLADASVDLLTAAQAFHWSNIEPARHEALRVLEARGQVALLWNDRVLDEPLQQRVEHVHELDRDGLASLAFSRSYMPASGSDAGRQAAAAIAAIFDRLSTQGRIAVRYRAVAMVGRPQAL